VWYCVPLKTSSITKQKLFHCSVACDVQKVFLFFMQQNKSWSPKKPPRSGTDHIQPLRLSRGSCDKLTREHNSFRLVARFQFSWIF
jgi:hypothetical protein